MAANARVVVTNLNTKLKAAQHWLIKWEVLMAQVMLLCLLTFPLSEMCMYKVIFII